MGKKVPVLARPEHEVAYQDLCALMNKHSGELSSLELLAVGANMLGKLIALQDQREVTSEMAMKIVSMNIEEGNRQVIMGLVHGKGGTA